MVITFGESLIALYPETRGRLEGRMPFVPHVAGAECNVAVGLSRLGVQVGYLGAVGPDPFGRLVRATLRGEGVEVSGLQTLDHPTALFFVEEYGLTPEPRVYYYRKGSAGSRWAVRPEDLERLQDAQWLHTSGITFMLGEQTRSSAETLVTKRSSRVVASLDINFRRRLAEPEEWRRVLEPRLSEFNVVFASREELGAVFGANKMDEIERLFPASDGQVLIVKEGAKGAWCQSGNGVLEVPAFDVANIVNVIGAGDGFAAGVIAGRLRGWDWQQAIKLGNLVGAFAVAHPGDFEGYPTQAEVEQYLGAQWVER